MICYLTNRGDTGGENEAVFPIFLQYTGNPKDFVRTVDLLEPHGNAKKTTRAFISTAPTVIANIKVSQQIFSLI